MKEQAESARVAAEEESQAALAATKEEVARRIAEIGASSEAHKAAADARMAELSAELEATKNNLAEREERVVEFVDKVAGLEAQVGGLEDIKATLEKAQAELEAKYTETDRELGSERERRTGLETDLAATRETLCDQGSVPRQRDEEDRRRPRQPRSRKGRARGRTLADRRSREPPRRLSAASELFRLCPRPREHVFAIEPLMLAVANDVLAVRDHVDDVARGAAVDEPGEHVAARLDVRAVQAHDDNVGALPTFERADLGLDPEGARTVDGRELEGLACGERRYTRTHLGEERGVAKLHPRVEVVVARRAVGAEGDL